MATDVLYPPHIPVSALTNRPIEGRLQQSMPNFICAKCQVVLNTPMQAIQHFNGRCQNEKRTNQQDTTINTKPSGNGSIKTISQKLNNSLPMDSDNNPLFKCDTCDCVFNSKVAADQHFTGKKHLFNVEEVSHNTKNDLDLVCNVCNAMFNSQKSAEQHYSGKKHAMMVNGGEPLDKMPSVIGPYHCSTCNVTVTSQTQLEQHTIGVKHKLAAGIIKEAPEWWQEKQKTYQDQLKQPKSAKKDSKVVQQFPCNDCSIVLNSQIQLSQHLTSQKHKDMLTQKNIKPGRGRGRGLKRPMEGAGRGQGRGQPQTRGRGQGRGLTMQRGRGGFQQHGGKRQKQSFGSGSNYIESNFYQPKQQQRPWKNGYNQNNATNITDRLQNLSSSQRQFHNQQQQQQQFPAGQFYSNSQIGGNQFQSF